jgi:hypothetical protein
MAVNTSKTKYIIFRTQGKKITNNDCVLYFNSNEPGRPEDPALISPLERIFNDGQESHFKLLGVLLDEYCICLLMLTSLNFVQNSPNCYSVSIV